MTDFKTIFDKVYARSFNSADSRKLIKESHYFAGKHADVHIVLSASRPPDYGFDHVPSYEERSRHSMFLSMDDAAEAVAAALNCRAGEAALRFLAVRGVRTVAIYSRSGAQKAREMTVRSAIASNNIRTGTMYGQEKTEIVVVVLSIHAETVALTTAYPAHMPPKNRPNPPEKHDLVEYGKDQVFSYAVDLDKPLLVRV